MIDRMMHNVAIPFLAGKADKLAESLWKGKKFEMDGSSPILRNMIELTDKDGKKNTPNLMFFKNGSPGGILLILGIRFE